MPSRNTVKIYIEDSYYHVYNRGVAKQNIFLDKQDYAVFLNLLKRYLSPSAVQDNRGRDYGSLRGKIELLAFCLMPNHLHLFFYQVEPQALAKIMQSVCTSYAVYFNKKYKRVGPIFQGVYKASRVDNDSYLLHATRYIHLNPDDYVNWQPSSVHAYLGKQNLDWLQPERVLSLFSDRAEYSQFLTDFEDYKNTLDSVKQLLVTED